AYLGKEVRFANMDFGSLIAAVSTGKVDMISSSIYVTEERKKQINFSDAYYQMGTRVFALKKNISAASAAAEPAQGPQHKLSTVDDLKDKRIGVLLGSVHDTYAMEHYPKSTILQYKSLPDLVLAVKLGKVDAAIYTRETLIELLRSDNELGLLGDSLQSYPIGMGFNKNNDHLRERFNVFLKQIKSNGEFDDMVKRWLKNGSTEMPEIPNTGANGVLVVGIVSDKGLPFAIVKDGKLVGFDIELAERFGAYLGKKVQYADMEFGNLIAAVSSGKIDMIDSTLMLTEERKSRIDFSDPYYELGANVFALRKNLATHDEAGFGVAAKPPTFFERIVNSFRSNIIQENRYLLIWDGLKTTVVISIFATLFGTLLGALVCFMRMSKRTVLNLPARIYINTLRGMPVLVLLMLIFYVVFASVDINPVLVAIIAFGMNFAAYVSEIFRSGIEGVGKGQIEAGIAMGFTKFKTFVYIVLPQTVQRILPVYKGEFISLVKMTSIVGYIAVQDLTKASDIIRSRTFDAFFPLVMVAILYFVISWILMQSLEYLERITDPKYKRRKAAKA
ncbi:MAG: ABC transporter permease subunit, partial [Methylobacter sp.]